MNRREFIKSSAAAVTIGCGASLPENLFAEGILQGNITLDSGWKDFSPTTGKQRKAIPSACHQCFVRDGIVGYVENDRLVKIEGNPALPRTNGKLCSKGQAGAVLPYHPDRLLYPLLRAGKRGEGKWRRISWEEAINLLVEGGRIGGRRVKGLRELRDSGQAHKLLYHFGRQDCSESEIMRDFFLRAYGTSTVIDNIGMCISPKYVAQQSIWGQHLEIPDFEKTGYVLNFSANVFECYHNHVPAAQRLVNALAADCRMVTFDVRLSNTAAKSEWIPIKPGTDTAVILALCHVVINELGVWDEPFLTTYTNVTVKQIKKHVEQYPPEFAEEVSGVSAKTIRRLAQEYISRRPSVCITHRGAVMHHNGLQAERAASLLDAIAGNVNVPGGRCLQQIARWKHSFQKAEGKPRKLDILDGEGFLFPTHNACHQLYKMVSTMRDRGRMDQIPQIYMLAVTNPAYSCADNRETMNYLKDEELFPFIVNANIGIDETADLSDLLLPDATYLERWRLEDGPSASHQAEYYIGQPMHPPLGEARNFVDVCLDIGRRLDLGLPFQTALEFVRNCCENTPGVREAGGFAYMCKHGAWYDKARGPVYAEHTRKVDVAGCDFDVASGVFYFKKEGDPGWSEMDNVTAAQRYRGQLCGDYKVRRGFAPTAKFRKSGLYEIYSDTWGKAGLGELPGWFAIPEHQDLKAGSLILTTYKHANMNHSRGNWCWPLVELYHDNPAWINSRTARELGIASGDSIKVTSPLGSLFTHAHVTEGVVPGVIAMGTSRGHWRHSYWATGRKNTTTFVETADTKHRWWAADGVHPNWIIPNRGESGSGGLQWMDTVVSVEKA